MIRSARASPVAFSIDLFSFLLTATFLQHCCLLGPYDGLNKLEREGSISTLVKDI